MFNVHVFVRTYPFCSLVHLFAQLTVEEQAIFRSGAYQLIPNHDRKGRGVIIIRMSKFDLADNIRAVSRCLWYVESAIEQDAMAQQNGVVLVADYRGTWKSSPFQFVRLLSTYPFHAMPIHVNSVHGLCVDSFGYEIVQSIRKALPKEIRLRTRLHPGSSLETEYASRTFGIDLSRQLFRERDGDENDESIELEIHRRQKLDDEWRKSEAPCRDSNSPTALFPNPQDIIMGRNRLIAGKWPGNMLYLRVIEQYVHRYMEAQALGLERIDKTLIAIEILQTLQQQYKSRFLTRTGTSWLAIEDSVAQTKISHKLRFLSRTTTGPSNRSG